MNSEEIENTLRNLADAYEKWGVHQLQRVVMRAAADEIASLRKQLRSHQPEHLNNEMTLSTRRRD